MKKIGNILFDKVKDNTGLFNVCDEQTTLPSIPSLIVGWDNVKKLYPNKSIIGWEINESTYWTFGRREKRDRYEKDIEKFKQHSLKRLINDVEYVFFDMFLCDNECKAALRDLLFNEDETNSRCAFINDGMLYLYSKIDNVVYGIKLGDIDYEGKDSNAVLSFMRRNNSIKFVNNISFEMRRLFNNNMYIIPYIYSE